MAFMAILGDLGLLFCVLLGFTLRVGDGSNFRIFLDPPRGLGSGCLGQNRGYLDPEP